MIKTSQKKLKARNEENEFLAAVIERCRRRDSRPAIKNRCLMCIDEILLPNGERGTGLIEEYNHCIPRSRLPGRDYWSLLHWENNLCGSCRAHHQAYDRRPELWLPLMEKHHHCEYTDRLFLFYLEEGKKIYAEKEKIK